ncbi:4-azaleucine resistance transporter AzlC [Arcanobacterium wilhelmae]|uniref:4-azaleucine resistance transporter AzlC n=1 Tax=Arcanobacterium wilhelmae TaxID=1803177 RepID=A0ABT9NCX4_9ACTO|nr:AzlC family ABC transporter permease [Arcanobacterium wilhelmae]MDP9801578.1 4-azaleucine resistance transporter AzlC [Arcanobacterium wilhelmae]WFN90904.1 AzlC family ABC transporter permease [Arcanobacterium wilhelmae]
MIEENGTEEQQTAAPASRRESIGIAAKISWPIFLAYLPLGMGFGVLMAKSGWGPQWAGLSAAVVYAGSLEYLVVVFLGGGFTLGTVALMAFLLNSRHMFYGLPFLRKFRSFGPRAQAFLIYTLTDENFALHASYRHARGDERLIRLVYSGLTYFYWVFSAVLGGVLGAALPFDSTGLEFSLTALFVVIAMDQIRQLGTVIPAVVAVAASAVAWVFFGRENFLLPALLLALVGLLALRGLIEEAAR